MADAKLPEILFQHRVSYGETDAMGVLYYAEYLHIFERARTAFTHILGLPYKEVEERGIYLPVREAQCRYRSPARYDDLLNVLCGIAGWRPASFKFTYRVTREADGVLIAEGLTSHALVNKAGKPVAVPDWFREVFAHLPGQEK
ncbi:MAG: acyl-CoA thioesterase [Desulfovibrio sp.]|jgi:acyl-CoA thioester hydrolase|nr:acyl-CoA thioesterase [Desulfovibrio sp.]